MKQRLGIAQALLNRPKLLICDEPTSALDPVGRKEILDILLAAREQTTILFSTHILSDVERICTDVAFLEGGIIRLSGPLSQLKASYRSEEYYLELAQQEALSPLLQHFPHMRKTGQQALTFLEQEHALIHVLRFLTDQNILPVKLERVEPTLESLFMEVTQK